jgi:hypothetical protein
MSTASDKCFTWFTVTKMAASALASEAQNVWSDKWRHDDAECTYQMKKCGVIPANEVSKVIKEYGATYIG